MSALSAGDDATVLGLVDPAIELVPLVVAAGLVPDAYRGLDGIRAYLEDADAADVERGFVATRVRGAQDTVVAFGDVLDGPAGATMPALWIWRFRDGPGHARDAGVRRGRAASRAQRRRASAPRRAAPPAPRCGSRCPRCPRAPATRAMRSGIWAENLTLTRPERNDVLLAVSEAATNVVRHALPRRPDDAAVRPRRRDQRRSAADRRWPTTASGSAPPRRTPASAWACRCSASWPTRSRS